MKNIFKKMLYLTNTKVPMNSAKIPWVLVIPNQGNTQIPEEVPYALPECKAENSAFHTLVIKIL